MADIFISYAREDRAEVERLAGQLEAAGLSCWWDRRLAAGARYLETTEAELNSAKAVLVVWSRHSVGSHWVADEAGVGRDSGRLAPISIDGSVAPLGFRQFQVIDFTPWREGDASPVHDLVSAISQLAPDAELRVAAVEPPPSKPVARQWRVPVLIAAGVVAAGLIAWAGAAMLAPRAAPAGPTRIAVLRFDNLGDTEPYFAEGVADELISELSKIAGIEVVARSSSFALTGDRATPANANKELGATLVLTGSVRRLDESVRVQAQLVSAPSGKQIWAKPFERPDDQIFALQRDIAIRVARTAQVQLQAPPPRQVDPEAYRLYQEGRRGELASGVAGSVISDQSDLFLRAVERDPRFAEAWSALGRNRLIQISYRTAIDPPTVETFKDAVEAADRALAIDPTIAEAWVTKSDAAAVLRDWDEAARFADEALKHEGFHPYIALIWTGHLEQAREILLRSERLNPLDARTLNQLSTVCSLLGDTECWRSAAQRQFEMYPDDPFYMTELFEALIEVGDMAAATKVAFANPGLVDAIVESLGETAGEYFDWRLGEGSPPKAGDVAAMARNSDGQFMFAVDMLNRSFRGAETAKLLPSAPPMFRVAPESLYDARAPDLRETPEFWKHVEKLGLVAYWRDSERWPDFCKFEPVCETRLKKQKPAP